MEQTYIVSYPRSGNGWIRFLLANILYPEKDVNYISVNTFMPDACQRSQWHEWGVKNTAILKHHSCFLPEYRKVIYLYRDGRDVALSLYYFNREDEKGVSFSQFLEEKFIPGKLLFHGWKQHLEFWLVGRHDINFISIRYEDMLVNLPVELKRITDFCGIETNTEIIQVAIAKSAYKELLKIRPRDGMHPKHGGLQGASGGWRDMFSDNDTRLFWEYAKDLMKKLKYGRNK